MIAEIDYQRDPASGQPLFDANGYPLIVANPSANTYGMLQTRVQYETLGPATAQDVQNAISDALTLYEQEAFWFNDMRTFGGVAGSLSNLQTVDGKEFYSSQDLPVLTNMPHIRQIMVLAFANRYPLKQRTQQWIDDQSISTTWQGLPTDWCWSGNSIRLYPVPNGGYPLIIEGTIRFQPLVNTSDYNVWTNRGERLIRLEAKRILFKDINRDAEQAASMEAEIYGDPRTGRQGALAILRRESMRRAGGPGRFRASKGYM